MDASTGLGCCELELLGCKRHLRVFLATRRHVVYIDLSVQRGSQIDKEHDILIVEMSYYSTVGAVMTPRPKNSLIVPNLSLLRRKAS